LCWPASGFIFCWLRQLQTRVYWIYYDLGAFLFWLCIKLVCVVAR
jgi:hypothetical protein